MIMKTIIFSLLIGILGARCAITASENESTLKRNIEAAATSAATEVAQSTPITDEANKEKRQIDAKDTALYPNHRTESDLDDPEIAQETIYGPKPNQFIIRAVSPHQHHQHEDHQDPQLRNYQAAAATATAAQRSHNNQQQLDQSQEIQHFAYLQDLSRNHPKVGASSLQGKSRVAISKKGTTNRAQIQFSKPEEAEQRYAVAIQAPLSPIQQESRQYQPSSAQYQHDLAQQQQQYQIIPEEHFLKLIEQELQARAYQDEQIRQQHVGHAQTVSSNKLSAYNDRSAKGLSNYRQRINQQTLQPTPSVPAPTQSPPSETQPTASLAPTPSYVQYVPRHRGGPKYLPLSQAQQQYAEQEIPEAQQPAPELPPQIAYYQPQISYKTLPNHPLAKSSLEKEIEKLFATNQPSAASVQILDNSNEPSAVVNHHYQPQSQPQSQSQHHQQQQQQQVLSNRSPKSYLSNTTPNSLLDANNQPFVPSLFRFSNYQTPTPIYPTQLPQQVIEAKKLGPVVYPTQQTTTVQPAQPSQYYYQEASPNSKTKSNRPKQQYDVKLLQSGQLKQREKAIKISSEPKYAYDFNNQAQSQSQSQRQHQHHQQQQHQSHQAQSEFYPSPHDPSPEPATRPQPNQVSTHAEQPQNDYRQYASPSPAPSQSSIFVSQGTGITTPSRPTTHIKHKTIEDVKQLRLPQPGGKPLTQAEFQALIDAGYPVTAIPVPVPVPFEQYFKDHPEYRNNPLDYAQIMRNARQQYATRTVPRLGLPSEPSVKIISSPSESQAATGLGGGSITYLRPIQSIPTNQRRHPRNNEKETKNAGDTKESTKENKNE